MSHHIITWQVQFFFICLLVFFLLHKQFAIAVIYLHEQEQLWFMTFKAISLWNSRRRCKQDIEYKRYIIYGNSIRMLFLERLNKKIFSQAAGLRLRLKPLLWFRFSSDKFQKENIVVEDVVRLRRAGWRLHYFSAPPPIRPPYSIHHIPFTVFRLFIREWRTVSCAHLRYTLTALAKWHKPWTDISYIDLHRRYAKREKKKKTYIAHWTQQPNETNINNVARSSEMRQPGPLWRVVKHTILTFFLFFFTAVCQTGAAAFEMKKEYIRNNRKRRGKSPHVRGGVCVCVCCVHDGAFSPFLYFVHLI